MHAGRARVVGPADGAMGSLGAIGVRFLLDAADTGRGFALLEHPLPPRALAAPLHRHSREDEYSFVLEGRIGALLGDELVFGDPGDLVCKPRNQWHTFWNAGDAPARILEIISPAGFERFFDALTRIVERPDPSDPAPVLALAATYGLELDVESVPRLLEQHGLHFD